MRQTLATLSTVQQCLGILRPLSGGETTKEVISALEDGRYLDLVKIKSPVERQHLVRCETDRKEFVCDYLAYNLMRKYPFLGLDREGAALAAFSSTEGNCRVTNDRLGRAFRGNPTARKEIFSIRAKIERVLGPFDWNLAQRNFAWGPGATTRLTNKEGDVYFKFRGKPETTLFNLPCAVAAIGMIPIWFGALHPLRMEDMLVVVPGSKVVTVPKDMKTDRTIAIEPDMNMYIQKGIGTMIRSRLKRVGVDLNDQSRNQELARHAYSRGLATIDLSMASDSVSSELVELLIPADWLSALKRCRSPRHVLASQIYDFEKFSSMGNGYTFELESLIFWAITQRSIERTRSSDPTIGIYGDDIICHESVVSDLVEQLSFFGFDVNQEKSYASGNFYESCGKHYFRGLDVTPVYVKEPVVHPLRLVWLANSIARWGKRVKHVSHTGVKLAWSRQVACIPPGYRLPIPDGIGDGGLVAAYFENDSSSFATTTASDFTLQSTRLNRTGVSVESYQRGFSFRHYVEVGNQTLDRDPSDVPYLLRNLYRLEERHSKRQGIDPNRIISPIVKNKIIKSLRIDDLLTENEHGVSPALRILKKAKKKRGWTSSWEHIELC